MRRSHIKKYEILRVMDISYWKYLPKNTELTVHVMTNEDNEIIKCKYSHMLYNKSDGTGCIYCCMYDKEIDDYESHPTQFLDCYENVLEYQTIECNDIIIINETIHPDNFNSIYVPIDNKYIDNPMLANCSICYDYMDQGWCDLLVEEMSNLCTDTNGTLSINGEEGVWIKECDLEKLKN
jgi:hypothetical protein